MTDQEIINGLLRALTFYADRARYRYTGWQGDMNPPTVLTDCGEEARIAIERYGNTNQANNGD